MVGGHMINKLYDKFKKFIKENYKFLITLLVIIFVFYYEFPYIIYKSGGTIDLKDRVILDKNYSQKGSLKMSYVTTMKGTIPFLLLSKVLPDWDIEPLDNESYDEIITNGKNYLNEGIDNAIIAAFKETDYSIKINKEMYHVIYIDKKANTDIKLNDEIISIDNKEMNNFNDIKAYINSLNEKDKVLLKVKNNGKDYDRYAILYRDEDNSLKMGIGFKTTYDYETEIPVKIKMRNNESGSSGSFMMSLAIYNALTEYDITKGLNIVGTGTISSDGIVGEIGGVKYKVLAAENNKADIFFCPEENFEEAMEVKNRRKLKVEVIKIKSLKEAIDYLKNR
jgi:PDZ domain-containing protein